jgi:hypothetical protein
MLAEISAVIPSAYPSGATSHSAGRLVGNVIGEFLAESVLDTLEPEIADFMLATSITERTCGALASALSEQPRGLAMLEEVARRGLFLHRVDDHPGWFRGDAAGWPATLRGARPAPRQRVRVAGPSSSGPPCNGNATMPPARAKSGVRRSSTASSTASTPAHPDIHT